MIRSKYELEAMARLTLGKFFDYPIETLKCADKPDLQDEVHSYGIEVVEDCYPNEKKAERIFDEVWNVPYSDIATKKLAKFEEAGGKLKIEDNKIVGSLLGKSGNGPNHLIGVIRDKIKKLNGGGYAKFNTYGLYVYVSTTYLWDSYVQSVIDEVSQIGRASCRERV